MYMQSVVLLKLNICGLCLSWLLFLLVGFLEKWDQCVINALRGEFFCSMPPTLHLRDHAILLGTGPLGRLKVLYHISHIL